MFESRDQALQAYRGRGAFKGWSDMVLADYLIDGLRETDKGLELSCAPEWEASNYAAQAHNPYAALRRYRGPVRILKAEHGSLCSLPSQVHARRQLEVSTVPDSGHLFPMTHAEIVSQALLDLAV